MTSSRVHCIEHPVVQHCLTRLRDKKTPPVEWRALLRRLTLLCMYEVLQDAPWEEVEVETPLATARGTRLREEDVAVVPVLRAGLGMVEAVLEVVPGAAVGHVGLERQHDTLRPVTYYCKLPPRLDRRFCLILDPMLATGGSAAAAVDLVKDAGACSVSLLSLIAAPEGIGALSRRHPDVTIYVAAIDDGLNENAYIVPGLGDAGDRLYDTFH